MPTKSTKFDWSSEIEALSSDEFRATVPFANFCQEANAVGDFFRSHYKPSKATGLPGLNEGSLEPSVADEIEDLVNEAIDANSAFKRMVDPKADRTKLDRASEIVDEIHAVLEYYLADGVEDEHDTRFANVVSAHKDEPENSATLAVALQDYADLAEMYVDEIEDLGGFDKKLIAEAKALSKEFRAGPTPIAPTAEATRMLVKRNRLMQLIDQRVRMVRATVKFVFRKHPNEARKIVSPYERTRRVLAKAFATRKKNAAAKKPQEVITPNA